MPLEIRELTIRAVVNESDAHEVKSSGDGHANAPHRPIDEKRLLDLAMEQVVKLLKDKDER